MQKTKAGIDFEQEFWKAANELRGAVAENQYKDYELPHIFLKHLSEHYEVRKEELNEALHDKTSDYYTTDDERIVSSPAKHKEYTKDKAVINIYACKANK